MPKFSRELQLNLSLRYVALIAVCLVSTPDIAPAQAAGDTVILETLNPPRGDEAQEYLDLSRRKRLRAQVDYVVEVEGDLTSGEIAKQPIDRRREYQPILNLNGFGVVLALILIGGLLLLWLKFGGSGTLLSREPQDDKPDGPAPKAWKISDEDLKLDGRSLLARIAAMSDRTEAMILLLRHSLLAGAGATQVRFARSDTERSAMARLPKSWQHHQALNVLLQGTELAHYGGRVVSEADFDRALKIGQAILSGARHG
ncbi:hypothetical protein [Roseovarius albus]|uniref:hypothetical protein n=1 Tax=Roseovarius albus TaxID=1247867 RepID=UPI000A26E7BF|nr:hypothetical protein [Roseovarius albus]